MTQARLLLLIIGCMFLFHMASSESAENQLRRKFIILYDFSGPFEKKKDVNEELHEILFKLFDNQVPSQENANTILLKGESNDGISFFRPDQDDIDMYYFGLRTKDLLSISRSSNLSSQRQYEELISALLHKTGDSWQPYISTAKVTFKQYFNEFKQKRNRWHDGFTLSAYAYPGVLTELGYQYYKELIVIIVSDFRAGSTFGDKQDREILQQRVFKNNPKAFQKVVDANNSLDGQFYKIKYFDYALPTGELDDASNEIIHGIIGYKIKPHSSSSYSDNATIKIDSEILLKQTAYQSSEYEISPLTVNFSHNDQLQVQKIHLTIEDKYGKALFNEKVAEYDTSLGKLIASDNNDLQHNFSTHDYIIPGRLIELNSIINASDYEGIEPKVLIDFYTKYDTKAGAMPLLYQVDRSLTSEGVAFVSDFNRKVVWYGIPSLALLIALIIVFSSGRPTALNYSIYRFSDSFEKINYNNSTGQGRLKVQYRAMKEDEYEAKMTLDLGLQFRNKLKPWRVPLFIKLEQVDHPEGIDIHLYLKDSSDSLQYVPQGQTWRTQKLRQQDLPFKLFVGIKRNDRIAALAEPLFCKIHLRIWYDHRNIWRVRDELNFEESFAIGPNLGDNWYGLDPGTSGTCIAVGSQFGNLTIQKGRGGMDLISPSIIGFDSDTELTVDKWNELSSPFIQVGSKAIPFLELTQRFTFYQSVKKLLGYKNRDSVAFSNDQTIEIGGVEITSLMMKELINDFKEHIESDPVTNEDLLTNNCLKVKKAVVAIPNNFTASKTQAMVDSMNELHQFKEVRTITEAEAVVVYYIFNRKNIQKDEYSFNSETILVFDMGGATINTTLVAADAGGKATDAEYQIGVLGKLGYGLGGDSIDYFLIETIYRILRTQVSLHAKKLNFDKLSKSQKSRLSILARKFKVEFIIRNYYRKKRPDFLISSAELMSLCEELYGILTGDEFKADISEDDQAMKLFMKNEGHYGIFSSPHSELRFIYENVRASVNDILELNPDLTIDTLIFSGRSTLFPGVREAVRKTINERGFSVKEAKLGTDEIKSAVAKGACLYGIHNNAIRIDSARTNSHFGFLKSEIAGQQGYENLVEMGQFFNGEGGVSGQSAVRSEFNLDGKQVRFLQVMGRDAEDIVKNNEKHKFTTLAKVKVNSTTEKVQISVSEDDQVRCLVQEIDSSVHDKPAFVTDEEIRNANDEHYTWLI